MRELPPHAKRVFHGILFDVYQWEQVLFDGSTATFEVVQRLSTVQILAATPQRRIILLREEQPYVGSFTAVPGGKIERGDSPEQTVEKELLEEIGVEAESIELWQRNEFGSTMRWVTYDFVARNCRVVQKPQQEPGERIEPFQVTLAELLVEVEKPEFRNKHLADRFFRLSRTPGGTERLERLLFG
jgi:ADP-ribose pyrophosphatase